MLLVISHFSWYIICILIVVWQKRQTSLNCLLYCYAYFVLYIMRAIKQDDIQPPSHMLYSSRLTDIHSHPYTRCTIYTETQQRTNFDTTAITDRSANSFFTKSRPKDSPILDTRFGSGADPGL